MTIRPIVRYPDRRLTMPARPVTAFDDGLRELAADLLETMRARHRHHRAAHRRALAARRARA